MARNVPFRIATLILPLYYVLEISLFTEHKKYVPTSYWNFFDISSFTVYRQSFFVSVWLKKAFGTEKGIFSAAYKSTNAFLFIDDKRTSNENEEFENIFSVLSPPKHELKPQNWYAFAANWWMWHISVV